MKGANVLGMHIDEGANVQLCQSVRGQMPYLGRGQMSGGGGGGNISYTRCFLF